MSKCICCGKDNISSDEVGLTKKFMNKDALDYYCFDCLANKYKCSKENLLEYVKRLKKAGCTLFK